MKPDPNARVLVIGTTGDYIDIIDKRFPNRAVFVTDPDERQHAAEPPPLHEVLAGLPHYEDALAAINKYLHSRGLPPSGVACFDDESMQLASFVARRLGLPYPSSEAVAACRSKSVSKQLWQRAGLPCPEIQLVENAAQAADFVARVGESILKPLTGSGSELLFVCKTAAECADAIRVMTERLVSHPNERMYAPYLHEGKPIDPRKCFLIEQFVRGTEYSCDFIVDGGDVQIIRIAEKIPASGLSVGTTLAYVVPAQLPDGIHQSALTRQLAAAARAIGIERGICMIDLMFDGHKAMMIEMAPRPGGDCLPPLIRRSSGLDMLGLAMDFAERRPIALPPAAQWRPVVGVRFFTQQAGVIRTIDDHAVRQDPRVLEVYLKRRPGYRVVQPPEDYDSRLLGHAIFTPSGKSIATECREIESKLIVEFK